MRAALVVVWVRRTKRRKNVLTCPRGTLENQIHICSSGASLKRGQYTRAQFCAHVTVIAFWRAKCAVYKARAGGKESIMVRCFAEIHYVESAGVSFHLEHTKTDVMSDSSKDNTLPQTLHAQKPHKRTCFRSGLFNHLDDHCFINYF